MATASISRLAHDRLLSASEFWVEAICSEEALAALAPEWEALAGLCYRPSLCATPTWVSTWWKTFCRRRHGARFGLFVVAVRDQDSRLVGVMPFYEERSRPLRARRLRLIGDTTTDCGAESMTEEPTVLVKNGLETPVMEAIGEFLKGHIEKGRWDFLALRLLYSGPEQPMQALADQLGPVAKCRTKAKHGSNMAELPASWDVYRKELSKSMRDNLPYYPRLLTRHGYEWEVRMHRDAEAVAAATPRLIELHRGRSFSTRGKPHDSHMPTSYHAEFFGDLMTGFAAKGQGMIAELVVNGEVVASQAFIEDGEQLMVGYSGYDENWYKYSPLFVIDTVVFKDAMSRGVRRLNFMFSVLYWASRWNGSWTEEHHVAMISPRRPLSLLKAGVQVGTYELRKLAKKKGRQIGHKLPAVRTKVMEMYAKFMTRPANPSGN